MIVRENFNKDLRHLQDEILRMGSEVENNLIIAVRALRQRNLKSSQEIVARDNWINEMRVTLTMDVLTLIATQQPTAKDLRLLASVMNIAGELERIHDYVKGIGKISLLIGEEPIPAILTDEFSQMAQKTSIMLHRALDSFIERNAGLAKAVIADDDQVDELFNIALKKLMEAMVQNQAEYEQINRLGWANHNLERSADRVCNICEWVLYTATGKFEQLV